MYRRYFLLPMITAVLVGAPISLAQDGDARRPTEKAANGSPTWQSDWLTYVDELAKALESEGSPISWPSSIRDRYIGKPVTWQGVVEKVEKVEKVEGGWIVRLKMEAHAVMIPRVLVARKDRTRPDGSVMELTESQKTKATFQRLEVVPLATTLDAWKAIEPGSNVRFRAKTALPLIFPEILISVSANDGEPLGPVPGEE